MAGPSFADMQKAGVPVSVDALTGGTEVSIRLTGQSESSFGVAIGYATPDASLPLDAAFIAGAALVTMVETGIVERLAPYLLPELYPGFPRDPAIEALFEGRLPEVRG